MSDPTGNEYTQARAITDSLTAHGCLTGGYPTAQPDEITASPVFQAFRRATSFYRIVRRQELLSYSVQDGVAVLRFKRNAWGFTGADAFEGIAPPGAPIASGSLVAGEVYVVRGTVGGVSYGGRRCNIGDQFTADAGPSYLADGDAQPWVLDGIRHTALKKGWSNEWVFFLQTHVFKEEFDSLWKPEIYADYFGFGERALFYLPSAPTDLIQHANTTTAFSVDPVDGRATWEQDLTRAQFINPEAPTGYRYAAGVNTAATSAFRKSCQVYEKPIEIESCTLEFDGPEQIVVLTLSARPFAHPDAPAVVDADPTAWSADDLARLDGTHATNPEDYRTADNALREFLRWAIGDHSNPSLKVGDHAAAGTPYPTPWGNVMPTFHFVRLIPEAYEDDNETAELSDTRMLAETQQQAEWYLRAMCEGFVDDVTSSERTCRNASDAGLYNYQWETVNFEAHGGRDCGPFPDSVRDDRPAGFGPLPNTIIYADVHNRLVKVVNLLTKLRLDVPVEWSTRTYTYFGYSDLGLDPGTWGYCDDVVFEVWRDRVTPPQATTLVSDTGWTAWSVGTSVILGMQETALGCAPDASNEWWAVTQRTATDWRVRVATGWDEAVPTELLELLNGGSYGVVVEMIETRSSSRRVDVDPRTSCGLTPGSWQWQTVTEIDGVRTCQALTPGIVEAPRPPGTDLGTHRPPGGSQCSYVSLHSIEAGALSYPAVFVTVPLSDLP